jgi:hypothetical protein
MPRHMSNAQRIAKAAAEAEATEREKAEKKPAAPRAPRASRARQPKPPVRMKVVWTVCEPGGPALATFPYPERAAADADAARRGKGCIVKPVKVPME